MSEKMSDAAARELLGTAMRLAEAARIPILRHYLDSVLEVANKSSEEFDPVTDADREGEMAIRETLATLRPDDGIIGEEYGNTESRSGLTWVIDPIDGTRSFILGFPLWTTLIGLHDGTSPVLGIIDQPYLGECYWGLNAGDTRQASVLRRGKVYPLRVRPCPDLANATIATTHRDAFASPANYQHFRNLETKCRLSRHGGDAYQYGALANGKINLIVETGLETYDIVAPIAVVEAAGGIIRNWEGGDCSGGGKVLAASCNDSYRRALEILNEAPQAPEL